MAVTIKSGQVYSNDTLVGTVEKIVHDGIWATSYGIRAGGTEWKGTAPDGTVFDGLERRKDAVARLVAHARPLEVTSIRVETFAGRPFITATVSWQGHTAMVSQYPHETDWVVDCYYTPGAFMPAWANGTGARYTIAKTLKPEQAAAVNAAVAAADLTIEES